MIVGKMMACASLLYAALSASAAARGSARARGAKAARVAVPETASLYFDGPRRHTAEGQYRAA